jgi:4a-hydroxytetrahydrobiopterin dehydratase
MKLTTFMKEYLEEPTSRLLTEKIDMPFGLMKREFPVIVKKITWEVEKDPERLVKDFSFSSTMQVRDFVNELFAYQDEADHHAKITIDHQEVRISIHTKNLDYITELDKEFAQAADDIHQDILHYSYENREEDQHS